MIKLIPYVRVKDRTSDFAKMSPAAAVSVSQLALPMGAMPAVGFGCWKLGKDIAADKSKENPIDLSICFQFQIICGIALVILQQFSVADPTAGCGFASRALRSGSNLVHLKICIHCLPIFASYPMPNLL
jgi:hypothetical protein